VWIYQSIEATNMNYQVCTKIHKNIHFILAPTEAEIEACLLDRIRKSNADQVIVTGRGMFRISASEITNELSGWKILYPPDKYVDTSIRILKDFAKAIIQNHFVQHICFCVTEPNDILIHLISEVRAPYELAVFVIGITGKYPLKILTKYKRYLNLYPWQKPQLECILSADDADITMSNQEAFKAAFDNNQPVDEARLKENFQLIEIFERKEPLRKIMLLWHAIFNK
jgi:hypothetical protein